MDYPKSVPGVGLVNNEFVDEDEVSGAQGSLIPAKWGNDVTKEILGVLAEAGIEPDEANPAQLRAAVVAIVDKVAPVATKAEAETNDEATANNVKRMTPLRVLQAIKARLINASEVVAGMLRVGTQDEVNAGALDNVAVTPKKLRWGFAVSLTANGYVALPSWLGGVIVQWVTGTGATSQTSETIAWPLQFPNQCFKALVSSRSTNFVDAQNAWHILRSYSATSVAVHAQSSVASWSEPLIPEVIGIGF